MGIEDQQAKENRPASHPPGYERKTKTKVKMKCSDSDSNSCGVGNAHIHSPFSLKRDLFRESEWSYRESASEKKTQQKSI